MVAQKSEHTIGRHPELTGKDQVTNCLLIINNYELTVLLESIRGLTYLIPYPLTLSTRYVRMREAKVRAHATTTLAVVLESNRLWQISC